MDCLICTNSQRLYAIINLQMKKEISKPTVYFCVLMKHRKIYTLTQFIITNQMVWIDGYFSLLKGKEKDKY
jgi:hypothetical protein